MSEEEDYPEVERIYINTPKELATEFDNFDKVLVDTTKDWKLRLNALKRLEGIILGGGFEIEEFIPLLTKLYSHFTAQLNDLRSAISKEACKLVCIAAEYGQGQIENLSDKLISKQSLLKLINSATKILSENGHECVKSLIKNVRNFKVIPKLTDEINTKNTAVRQKISEYLCIVTDIFEPQILEKYQIVLEDAINTLICDANKEVRLNMRQTFAIYAEKFPPRGEKLFSGFDASVQKPLVDEGHVDTNIYLRKTSSNSSATREVKANQRPSSASAKKGDMKSGFSSPTANFGRASGSNGFASGKMSESEKSSPVLAKSALTPSNEEKIPPKLRQSDMYAEGKVGTNKLVTKKLGFEKKGIEASSADLKPKSHVPQIKQSNSLGSKSISDDSTKPPTRTSSKYASSQRLLTAKDVHLRQESPSISSNGYDFEGSNGSYQYRREEDLYVLLDNANSDDWAARASAFEQINEFISDIKPQEHLSSNLMEQLIQTHIQHINDHHYKVVVSCQESFSRLITIYNSRVLSYLDQIIPQLFINLTEGKEKVSASTNFLINLINKIYSGDELLPHFLRSLESYSKIKYKTSMVEFMNILIRNCETYFNSPSAIRICISKFANIIGELTSTKSIVMPCLGMILYLRDINLSATIAAIGALNNDLITKLRGLAAEYAPDLEENIQFYLQQTKGFAKAENRTSTSTTNSATTSASKSDSINRYDSNPNTKKPPTPSDLRSRPVPSNDLNNYNSRDRYDVKKQANERQSSVGGRPVSASTANLGKVLKTPRDNRGLPLPSTTTTSHLSKSNSQSTTATIKSRSVQQSIQIEPSREVSDHDEEQEEEEDDQEEEEEPEEEEEEDEEEEEQDDDEEEKNNDDDNEEEEDEEEEEEEEEDEENNQHLQDPLQTEDVDDFLQAESEAEREVLGQPQQRLAEIVKIESLVSEYPKNKIELQKKLKYVLTTLVVPNPSDDLKVYEYTLNILLKLLKLPLDFTNEIPLLISGIISLYNVPTKTKYSIDDILRAVLELGYIEQSLETLIECLQEADHPIVQIITKNITKLAMVDKNQIIMNYLPELIGRYKELIQHANPDVRKNVVFSIVELYFLNQQEMQSYVDSFSANHQKLISIYIQKKNESAAKK